MTKNKRLKVRPITHSRVKAEAKQQGMFIDEFLIMLLNMHQHQKLINEVFEEAQK